ncbi:hypothetical protein PHAVU_011G164200 [Phaseolus vulgaris]|uniref:Uncharacterized protein n=1 Tax=Phaseolus vulgaris TaxID=3885 RepID=V7AM80_PHAVU|nr:hypothetical protein PHAVU_011G164200g [Phaseolus vulgaris]ESW05241.1 hypothetical protein PHAVU_011G164200g [Phaseolus vulgaris]
MRGGLPLLHLASQSGDIKFLNVLLKTCPNSVKDLTVRNEIALHFAVIHDKFETFDCWVILKQEDVEGNTILHIAATKDDTEAMRWLIEEMSDLNAENLIGI